jgi:hypothetical protein
MARTFIRQESQIRPSFTYDDTLASGITLQTGAASIEGDLNSLRSQTKRVLGTTNWYDALSGRSLATLSTDLADIEGKKLLRRVQVLTDVAVTAAQNWEILVVASSETPTQVAAVAPTQNGAVVAQSALNGAGFDVHELIEVAGQNAISPKNLCLVRDATTLQKLQSGGRDIFALLQYESTGVDGAAFDDTSAGNRVKLSFVIVNPAGDDLIACPVVDIAGKTINYSYVSRYNFDAVLEDSYISPEAAFVDQSASVDVTRQNAYNNQGTTPVELTTDADLDLAASVAWSIRDAANADLLHVVEGSGGGTTELQIGTDVDVFNVDAVLNDFRTGVRANTAGTRPVYVGVNDGVVESSSGDLRVLGAGELYLDDGNQTGSTWAQTAGIKLSDTTAEWDAFETAFGEVSLLSAITTAYTSASETKTFANVTADVNADVNVSLADGNLDTALPDMSTGSFLQDYDVFVNGELMRPGADASANNDYYPGTSLVTAAQLKFEFKLKTGDVICVIKKVA